jgi:SHS2 domain-containing protein
MWEVFEHTADLGLRMHAESPERLYEEAAKGFFSMIVENVDDVQPCEEVRFDIEGADREYLLFDWLNELLYVFETKRLLLSRFHVALNESGLHATAGGERIDPERHHLEHEIKAITYHGLKVEKTSNGWAAEVIVDI